MLSGSEASRVTASGTLSDETPIERHVLSNASGMEVSFLTLGGIITSVMAPDRHGNLSDVTPGFDRLEDYLADHDLRGSLVARYENRIAGGRFVIDGETFTIPPNAGPNLVQGGPDGLHRAVWRAEPFDQHGMTGVALRYTSPPGEGGFPGTLDVTATYSLTNANELSLDYVAHADRPTPCNITQHIYFNLAGHRSGSVLDHELTIAASEVLELDDEQIPTGRTVPVAGTAFDFRHQHAISEAMRSAPLLGAGFDHTFVLRDGARAARLVELGSGRTLEVETTEPGLQLYTGNHLSAVRGKGGAHYHPHDALALETQHFPNSPNVPQFPDTILRLGGEYRSRTVYRFGVSG